MPFYESRLIPFCVVRFVAFTFELPHVVSLQKNRIINAINVNAS